MQGRVTEWNGTYGFVAGPGIAGVFLHIQAFDPRPSRLEPPTRGDVIEFEVVATPKGPRAVRARLVARAQ